MTLEVERRAGVPVELRADDNGIRVEGYPAVTGQDTSIGDMWIEIIAPGAFRSALARDDVVFLINHCGEPLARTSSGTLKLSEDDKGLRMETVLDPEDPDVQRLVPKMKRGDMSKMSFAFRATRQEWDDTTEPPTRTIHELQLVDVSVVNTPAYEGTSIALRSLDEARKERRSKNFSAAARRVRMKTDLDLRLRGRSKA